MPMFPPLTGAPGDVKLVGSSSNLGSHHLSKDLGLPDALRCRVEHGLDRGLRDADRGGEPGNLLLTLDVAGVARGGGAIEERLTRRVHDCIYGRIARIASWLSD